MMVLVTYDVRTDTPQGRARLRKVAKQCVNFGQRVQDSVFECLVEPAQFTELRHRIERIIDVGEDSVRFYFLGANWQNRVEHIGAKDTYDPEGPLLA
jgi:CRISPR-associated protein Cas2